MIHFFVIRSFACLIRRNTIGKKLQPQLTMPSTFSYCYPVSLWCVFSLYITEYSLIIGCAAACAREP